MATNTTKTYPNVDWSKPQSAFFVTWFIIFTSLTIVTGIWFHQRRHIQPIKARLPLLNDVANLVNIFITLLLCSNRIFTYWPCELDQFQGYLYLLLATIYAIRCWVLNFRFNLTQELAMSQGLKKMGSTLGIRRPLTRGESRIDYTKEATHTPTGMWYARHGYLVAPWFLGLIYAVCTFVVLIFPFYAVGSGIVKDGGPEAGNNRCTGLSKAFQATLYLLYIVFYILIALRLKTALDYFHIKDELKWTGILAIPTLCVWLATATYLTSLDFPVSTLISGLMLATAQILATAYPLFLSYYNPPLINLDTPKDLGNFQDILAHAEGFESFRQFVAGEFAIENLLFFQTAEDFRELSTITLNFHNKDGDSGTKEDPESFKEGYLIRKVVGLDSFGLWHRRFIILKKGELIIYQDKKSPIDTTISLLEAKVQSINDIARRPFAFQVSVAKDKFLFQASDGKQQDSWVKEIARASHQDRESDDEDEAGDKKDDAEQGESKRTWISRENSSAEIPESGSGVTLAMTAGTGSMVLGVREKSTDKLPSSIPVQARRAPRGHIAGTSAQWPAGGATERVEAKSQSRLEPPKEKSDGISPLEGENWELDLLSIALKIFFLYVRQDAIIQVNLPEQAVNVIKRRLGLNEVEESSFEIGALSTPKSTHRTAGEVPPSGPFLHARPSDVELAERSSEVSHSELDDKEQDLDMQKVRKLAQKLLPKVQIDALPYLFSEAQQEIFNLMRGDSFVRYQRSHLYRDFVEGEKRKKNQIEALDKAGLN